MRSFLLRFGLGEGVGGYADERLYPFAVFDEVSVYQHRWFSAIVGSTLFVHVSNVREPRLRNLYKQLVVAHQRNDFVVAVQRVLAKHLPRADLPRPAQLIYNKFNG
jgi:hypothetical protein